MYREIVDDLIVWKDKKDRKVLLLAGGKGVGKSYTLADFGAGFFTNWCIFDLKKQEYVKFLFEDELDKNLILKKLSVSCGETIIPGKTLLIFENVDMLENVASIIEYLCDKFKEYHVAITLMHLEEKFLKSNEHISNKLDIMHLYPFSFKEFLIANRKHSFCDKIANQAKEPLSESDLERLEHYMKIFMIVGGMPNVVKILVDTGNMKLVEREKAKLIFEMLEEIEGVEQGALRKKIRKVFESIPMQLEKKNMKFQYGMIKLTARSREYKEAVEWLVDNKFVIPLYRAKEPIVPLSSQQDDKSFEMYVNDIGLLTYMYGLTYNDIANEESPFMLIGEALVKQYVYCEMLHNPNIKNIYYWVSDATAKIEFIFEDSNDVIPVEINIDSNEKAQSLKIYKNRYMVPMAVRISKNKISMKNGMLTLPLFSIWNL